MLSHLSHFWSCQHLHGQCVFTVTLDGCLVRKELESCGPGPAELDAFQKGCTTLKYTDERMWEERKREGGKERS